MKIIKAGSGILFGVNLAVLLLAWGTIAMGDSSKDVAGKLSEGKGSVEYFDVCDTRVVGWYWWRMKDEFPVSAVRFEDLTHIVYNPENELLVTQDGHIKLTGAIDENLAELTIQAHAQGVKVLMMMSEDARDFNVLMSKPQTRATFIREVVEYLLDHDLDGVEYDWEGNSHKEPYDWYGREGEIDIENYTAIIKETKAALQPHNLILTICGAAWPPCFVTPEAFEHLEFISIMSYRDFDHAVQGLKVWTDIGTPRHLLNMGMAVGFNEHGWDQAQAAKEVNYVVEQGYGGLMLFQISYDKKDDTSMLKIVGDTLRKIKERHKCKPFGPLTTWKKWHNSLQPRRPVGPQLTLTQNGSSNYSIVLSGQATSQDKKAAQELQLWLERMTTVKLPIVTEGDPLKDQSRIISIGYTRQLQDANLSAVKENLEDEGYGIAEQGKKLFLWGGRSRGVINAVFALLEEDLGCRWYTDKHYRIPKMSDLTFALTARTYKPALKLRDPYYYVAFNGEWSLRNRTNAPGAAVPEEWGGYMEYCGGDSTDHASMFVHTFHHLLPPDKYFKSHPEYFMLDDDGKRNPHQLCTTNDEVVALVTESVRRFLKANPQADIISVSKMDGGGTCLCSKCQALDDAEGTNMASLLYLVNQVAQSIEDEYPYVVVSTLAYLETVKVPKTIRPHKNVAIRLCSDNVGSWLRPFEPAEICQFGQLVKNWSAVHDHIYIWDYTVNFSHYLAPMPNMEVIARDIRFLVDNHAEGIMTQGAYQGPGAERDWLRSWVIAKLMWDPSRNLYELMQDFIWGHYGQAAPEIAAYNEFLRKQLIKHKDIMTVPHLAGPDESIRYPMDHPFLSKEFLDQATEIYDRAEELAENEQVLHRVQRDRLPIMYVKLSRGPEFVGEQYGKVLDRFEKIARREGVTHLREGSPDLKEKLATWRKKWKMFKQ